ncbi:MAG: hypothetical protein LUG18_09940 [Candidatus Azobacteroides sp.]|nr:hypothetical protein [Candidatus Azobacteroides sp.]
MRKKIVVLFLILSQLSLFSQKDFGKYGQWVSSDTTQYILNEKPDLKRFTVTNKSNKLYLEEYKPSKKLEENPQITISKALPENYNLRDIVKEVWSKQRAYELNGKESILTYVYMLDNGKFEEIIFYLPIDTSITPDEISLFENKIINTQVELRTTELKGSNYILIPFPVNFAFLLKE